MASTPQPLGFYGLDFEAEIETAIDGLRLHELTDLLYDMAVSLDNTHYFDNEEAPEIDEDSKPVSPYGLSDSQKISLIRGLCDRIEIKLMQVAK